MEQRSENPTRFDAVDATGLFKVYRPAAPLADFVEMFWYYETSLIVPSLKERVLPTGTVEFVIRLGKDSNRVFRSDNPTVYDEYRGAIVTGAQSKYFVLDKCEQDILLGVHFKPGGAFPFFRVPANELRDCHVSLDDLWGASAAFLREELLATETASKKFQILERYMVAAANRPIVRHPAVAFALRSLGMPRFGRPVAELAEAANLSQRRFIQLFSEQVGLTPKTYSRVVRFQTALQSLTDKTTVTWADFALSCGYYDQAHFNHDFKEFSGLNPAAYMGFRTEHLNHVPLENPDPQ